MKLEPSSPRPKWRRCSGQRQTISTTGNILSAWIYTLRSLPHLLWINFWRCLWIGLLFTFPRTSPPRQSWTARATWVEQKSQCLLSFMLFTWMPWSRVERETKLSSLPNLPALSTLITRSSRICWNLLKRKLLLTTKTCSWRKCLKSCVWIPEPGIISRMSHS